MSRYAANSLYPCNVHFKQSNPLIKDAASLEKEKRKLYKRENSKRKVERKRKIDVNVISFYVNCLCTAKKNNPVLYRKHFRQLVSFSNYLAMRARARSRAMARYFGRRHGAQWAKRYY